MASSFYIIDDDPAVRRILSALISEHIEEAVVFQNDDPWAGLHEILKLKADIVLLDLLMPEMDGLDAAAFLKKEGYGGKIIMISEVTSKSMIAKAYELGIEYFISKPINVTEVLSIVRKTLEMLQLKAYIKIIHQPGHVFATESQEPVKGSCEQSTSVDLPFEKRQKLLTLYQELGIGNESGLSDLTTAVSVFYYAGKRSALEVRSIQLMDVYETIQKPLRGTSEEISLKGIEQRLRRIVGSAMENLAHMGIEDFSHYRFEKYATRVFNFKSVKQEMDFLRKKSLTRGKIDVRKFIEGIVDLLE